jgi:LacI family transcriptional regulator
MKVRVKDIAEKAGVSAASVSNALGGKGGVSEETSKRILSIAREMGYAFESSAPGIKKYVRLVSFKRHGLVLMDTQFFAEMIEALERQCHRAGLEMVVSNINMEKDQNYLERVRDICQESCAGILLLATEMYLEDLRLFAQTRAPLLALDSLFHNERVNCVVMNNHEAGYMATERFIKMGHTRIEHITSRVRFNNMRDRRIGYERCMAEYKLPVPENAIWRVTPTLEGAYRDMSALLDARKEAMPTAFFAANDIMAVGCVRAMKEHGIRIPADVSMIGMDDLSICQITNPVLSTIRVFREEIARIAVIRLVDMMDETMFSCIQKTEVSVELVDRKSVLDLNRP